MTRFLLLGVVLWLLLFLLRISSLGGLDPLYHDDEVTLLKNFRGMLAQKIDVFLPYPQSKVLSGMILGEDKIPYFLKNDLKRTSTIHLVVVSGQNLSILAGFIISLASFIGRKKAITLTFLVIIFYSVLTGLQVPVLRASLMASLSLLAQALGKEAAGWWTLILTAGLMLIYQPNYLFSISFQLSFLATLGVVVVSPIIIRHFSIIPRILKEDLAVSLSAQALTLPIIAFNFGQVSLIGILVNSLILWSIPLLMISGFISLGLGLINTFLGQVFGLIPSILISYFLYISKFFAKFPGASLEVLETSWVLWVGYYLIIGALVWGLSLKNQKL